MYIHMYEYTYVNDKCIYIYAYYVMKRVPDEIMNMTFSVLTF